MKYLFMFTYLKYLNKMYHYYAVIGVFVYQIIFDLSQNRKFLTI